MKQALRALIAAGGAILVTGAGFASFFLGVHDSSPAQTVVQAITLPLFSSGLAYNWIGTDFFAWLAVALGAALWFGLIYAGLGIFLRRGTAAT